MPVHGSAAKVPFYRLVYVCMMFAFWGLLSGVCPVRADNILREPPIVQYSSPYSVRLPYEIRELIPDLLEGERGHRHHQSKISYQHWYNHTVVGPWGPLPREYMPPAIAEGKSAEWKRARVIAAALRFVGYHYRHHYIPDWDPPQGWHTPKAGGTRHDGKGVDCSNFTSFVYNQALGIGFSSDIHKQAAMEGVSIHGEFWGKDVTIIPRQESVAQWKSVLKPGDLLFIRPRSGIGISHVVIWLGAWGISSDNTPLILDSHGADVRDANKQLIPEGVHIRPFRSGSWYASSADHAIRVIQDDKQ